LEDENSKALSVARRNYLGEDRYDYLKVEISARGSINIRNIDFSIYIEIECKEMYEAYNKEIDDYWSEFI